MSPKEKMVFHRFDSFLNRLNTMVEFFNTAVQVDLYQFVFHSLVFNVQSEIFWK